MELSRSAKSIIIEKLYWFSYDLWGVPVVMVSLLQNDIELSMYGIIGSVKASGCEVTEVDHSEGV